MGNNAAICFQLSYNLKVCRVSGFETPKCNYSSLMYIDFANRIFEAIIRSTGYSAIVYMFTRILNIHSQKVTSLHCRGKRIRSDTMRSKSEPGNGFLCEI